MRLRCDVTMTATGSYMERHPSTVAIMIEVSCHMECAYFNSDYSQMPACALQLS